MPSPRKDKDKDKNKEPPSQPAANEGHPILTAAMYGRLDELRQIAISEPDSVRRKEQDGWTIAHWAARRGFINMLGFIADRAPGLLLSQDNNGAGPGHYAASYGHDGILSLMAERDPAALMVQDNEGNSPAHDATKHNRLITLKVLVESCPSLIYGSNAKGQRPVDVAERDEIKKFLKDSEKASMVPAVQLQNLTREARLLNAQNAVLALYCRNYWATNGSEATQIKVAEESTEHHMVHVEFARTMARAAVSAIQRVEDRPRLDRFLAARDAARQRHGSKWDDETMERWLFFMESDGDSVERAVTSMSGAFRNRSGGQPPRPNLPSRSSPFCFGFWFRRVLDSLREGRCECVPGEVGSPQRLRRGSLDT